jgi:hypothetical protein
MSNPLIYIPILLQHTFFEPISLNTLIKRPSSEVYKQITIPVGVPMSLYVKSSCSASDVPFKIASLLLISPYRQLCDDDDNDGDDDYNGDDDDDNDDDDNDDGDNDNDDVCMSNLAVLPLMCPSI